MKSFSFILLLLLNFELAIFMVTTANSDKVYKYLRAQGLTRQGACGMLGNIYSESGVVPETVEMLLIQRYDEDYKGGYSAYASINGGYRRPVSDPDNRDYNNVVYTGRLMDGTITLQEFLSPRSYTGVTRQYGYGLVGWTTKSRKQGLWDRTMAVGKPIYDIQAQVEYLVWELKNIFPTIYSYLTSSTRTLKECSDKVLMDFEAPADAAAQKDARYSISQFYYNSYN